MKPRFLLLLSACLLLLVLTSCGQKDPDPAVTGTCSTPAVTEEPTAPATEPGTETETEPAPALRLVSPEDGSTVSLLNDLMTPWAQKYRKAQLDKVCDFTEKCRPVPVTLSWEAPGALYCHVRLDTKADFSTAVTYLTADVSLTLEDLFMDTDYYWQVMATDAAGESLVTPVFTFHTMKGPRTLAIDGVTNARDVGGYTTESGARVKQGLIYRSAQIDDVTPAGIEKAVGQLGIRTDLDLRGASYHVSPLGEDVRFVSIAAPWYGGISDKSYYAAVAAEMRIFADEDNYPVLFHCSLGRDRTGTCAILLLALCGVDTDDILMDYEVSFFSGCGGFTDYTAPPSTMVNSNVQSMLSYLKGLGVKCGSRKLSDCTEYYLTEIIGLSAEEVASIRSILLDAPAEEVN